MAIVSNRQELEELSKLIPYSVRCIVDPNTITYPAIIKWVLVHDREETSGFANQEEAAIVPIVYAVPFDAGDLLDFYESFAKKFIDERTGIEGYDYAESEETDESTSGVIEGTYGAVPTETDIS